MSETVEQPSQSGTESAQSAANLFAAPPAESKSAANTEPIEGNEPETVLASEAGLLDADGKEITDQTEPDDSEELDLEGVKIKGRKADVERIKSERLMHADYTRKTQEVAEQRREVDTVREQLQQQSRFQQENLREFAQLHSVEERAAWLTQNMRAIAAQDPLKGQEALMELQQLQAAAGQLRGSLTHKQQQMQLATQQQEAKRANDAEAVVMREIKDWSPAKYRELQEFGQANGIQPETLRQMLIAFPHSVKFINQAMQHDKLLKQRSAKPAAPVPKPVTRVGGGGATNTKSLSDLSTEEWAAKRRERNSRR